MTLQKLETLTMTQMRDLMYKKETTATEVLDALLKEMRERKTKTSAKKVIRFINSFPLVQGITDEDIALLEEIRSKDFLKRIANNGNLKLVEV